jgi:formate/nitrite transporter FocA (FNT family)
MGVHDQFTPWVSLVIAVIGFRELIGTEAGGAGLKVTVMFPLGLVMVIAHDADLVGSVTEVALTVTVPALPGAV